jgi:alpha-L-rhamnosidase
VWLDVIPKDDQQSVMKKIMSASDPTFNSEVAPPKLAIASYYYRFYLARALVHAGLGDRYIETLGPWKAMVANGLMTWAEKPEPTRSDSHAWSAHPTYDLLSIVAGLFLHHPTSRAFELNPVLDL